MQGEEAVQYCFLQKTTYHFKATVMYSMNPSLFSLLLFSDVLGSFFHNEGQCTVQINICKMGWAFISHHLRIQNIDCYNTGYDDWLYTSNALPDSITYIKYMPVIKIIP